MKLRYGVVLAVGLALASARGARADDADKGTAAGGTDAASTPKQDMKQDQADDSASKGNSGTGSSTSGTGTDAGNMASDKSDAASGTDAASTPKQDVKQDEQTGTKQ